jgi:hypothetical protein
MDYNTILTDKPSSLLLINKVSGWDKLGGKSQRLPGHTHREQAVFIKVDGVSSWVVRTSAEHKRSVRSALQFADQAAGNLCRKTNPLPSGSVNRANWPHWSLSIGKISTPRAFSSS